MGSSQLGGMAGSGPGEAVGVRSLSGDLRGAWFLSVSAASVLCPRAVSLGGVLGAHGVGLGVLRPALVGALQ